MPALILVVGDFDIRKCAVEERDKFIDKLFNDIIKIAMVDRVDVVDVTGRAIG